MSGAGGGPDGGGPACDRPACDRPGDGEPTGCGLLDVLVREFLRLLASRQPAPTTGDERLVRVAVLLAVLEPGS